MHDDLISDIGRGENYGCANINEIYGYDPGGFIPFQNGGFEVTELYHHDVDGSYHITDGQSEAAQNHEEYLYECFARDYEDELQAAGIDTTDKYYQIPASLENTFADYESDFWEPALLRFCIFINKENDTIELSLSLNYSDAPYYRDKYDDDTLATQSIALDEFLKMQPEQVLEAIRKEIKL